MKPFHHLLFQSFLDTVFPKTCLMCQKALKSKENHVCLHCKTKLPFSHMNSLTENPIFKRMAGRIPISGAYSMLYFEKHEPVQQLLHSIKYRNQPEAACWLGMFIAKRFKETTNLKIDGVIPVPLHKSKLKIRGYNQAEKLAIGFAEHMKCPVLTDYLNRVNNGKSLARQNRAERLNSNLIYQSSALNSLAQLAGNYVIIDDVITTGGTMEACVQELLINPKMNFILVSAALAV